MGGARGRRTGVQSEVRGPRSGRGGAVCCDWSLSKPTVTSDWSVLTAGVGGRTRRESSRVSLWVWGSLGRSEERRKRRRGGRGEKEKEEKERKRRKRRKDKGGRGGEKEEVFGGDFGVCYELSSAFAVVAALSSSSSPLPLLSLSSSRTSTACYDLSSASLRSLWASLFSSWCAMALMLRPLFRVGLRDDFSSFSSSSCRDGSLYMHT